MVSFWAFEAASSSFNRWFSSASDGRWARPEKKLPTGRVTVVTASWSGAIAARVVRPNPASGPDWPWR